MGKITVITPSYRKDHLKKIKQSINFEYVDEWILVYDGGKIEANPCIFEENKKIREYLYKRDCVSGNGQGNFALTKIINQDTLFHYLEDDNIIHPN